jgi:hypothetical protein
MRKTLTKEQARKISLDNNIGYLVEDEKNLFKHIKQQARCGLTNAFIVVPFENISEITKILKDHDYEFWVENLDYSKYKKYNKKYSNLHEIEVYWH